MRIRLPQSGSVPGDGHHEAAHPGPAYSDLVATLTGLSQLHAQLSTRRGPVQVLLSDVVAARVVGAARRDVLALSKLSADGWRPAESSSIDGWLLRANSGWSRRANSALPLSQLQRPLDPVLDEVAGWYAARGLPTLLCLPIAARGLLDAELGRRRWTAEAETVVLSRPSTLLAPAGPTVQVCLEPAPSAAWYDCYPALPQVARELLVRHPAAVFASVRLQDQVVAIARGALDAGWLGISAVHVRPEFRRRGAGTGMIWALQRWATERGATDCYLQVEADNHPAVALYHQLGFTEHHRYHYRRMP